MAIQLSDDGGKHLYEQIYEYIRDEIKEGKLLAGEKLPSTRSLAEYLQVARSTVELAYGQLLSEGYIESSAYRGYYISRVEELYQIMTDMSQKEEEAADLFMAKMAILSVQKTEQRLLRARTETSITS